jgi:hypothetical protein
VSAVQPTPPEDESENPRIISPFAQTTSTVRRGGGSGSGSLALWVVSSLLVLVILGVVGYFTLQYLNDPYRTLEPFPMDKYLSDYHSMIGNKFKAELKVSASLDYQADSGRLMVFTLPDDSHSLVVLIPPKFSGLYFTKGQNYQASLEVQQDGIVYADSCEKE